MKTVSSQKLGNKATLFFFFLVIATTMRTCTDCFALQESLAGGCVLHVKTHE